MLTWTRFPLETTTFGLKSTPTVAIWFELKAPSQNRIIKLDFPTPESPIMRILNRRSALFIIHNSQSRFFLARMKNSYYTKNNAGEQDFEVDPIE